MACAAVRQFPEENVAELAHLYVNPSHANQGIGQKLVQFAEDTASSGGRSQLITLSTQAFAYFRNKSGFEEGSIGDLPAERRAEYEAEGRNSKILVKELTD